MSYAASILYKSIAGRYRPASYPDGPITARYRFIKNAFWTYQSSISARSEDLGSLDMHTRLAKILIGLYGCAG